MGLAAYCFFQGALAEIVGQLRIDKCSWFFIAYLKELWISLSKDVIEIRAVYGIKGRLGKFIKEKSTNGKQIETRLPQEVLE